MARTGINIVAGFDLQGFSTSAQQLQNQFTSVGKRLRASALDLASAAAVTLPISIAGAFSVKEFMEFENQMTKVAAVAEASSGEMKRLNDLAMDLGASTKYTATQISELAFNYSQLGFSVTEIEAITEATLNLALATGEDLAMSAEVAGNTLRGFGLHVSEMPRIVDVMAKSFSMSTLDLEKFRVAITKIAPIANQMGFSLEEVTAMMGILSDAGVDASIVGTSLRQIFVQLAKSGMTYDEAMAKIASSTNKVATAVEMFDVRGANAAVMLSETAPKLEYFTTELLHAEGAAAKMTETMGSSMAVQLDMMKASLTALAIQIGEQIAPLLRKLITIVKDLADWFGELSPSMKRYVAALGTAIVVVPPLIVGIVSLTAAMMALNVAMLPLTITIVAVTAVVASLAWVLMGSTKKVEDFTTALEDGRYASVKIASSTDRFTKKVAEEEAGLADAIKTLRYFNGTYEERGKLIDKINAKYGGTLQNLKDERAFVNQLDSAYKSLSESMIAKIRAQSKEKELAPLIEARDKMQASLDRLNKAWESRDKTKVANYGMKQYIDAVEYGTKKLEEYDRAIGKISYAMDNAGGAPKSPIAAGGDIVTEIKPPKPDTFVDWERIEQEKLDNMTLELKAKLIGEMQPIDTSKFLAPLYELKIEKSPLPAITEWADIQAAAIARRFEGVRESLNDFFESMTEDAIIMTAEMFGRMLTDDQFQGKDFGRGLLEMIANFMIKLGGLMVTMGVSMEAFKESLKFGNGVGMVVAGAAIIVAGAAIKGALSNGLDGGGSYSGAAPSYSANSANYGGYEFENTIRLEGREMIIVQKRENGFRR